MSITIHNLRTEYKQNPLGLGVERPRFSWELQSEKRGAFQLAYHLKCARTLADLEGYENLLWDTGRIESGESLQIEYDGEKLLSGNRVYWTLKVWGNHGEASQWAKPGYFEIGLLHDTDWKAQWLESEVDEDVSQSTPATYLRKQFVIKKTLQKATVYLTCRGLYELRLNGQKVSEHLFTPGWTSYGQRLQYQVYDVTRQLHDGENVLGVILGDGWYRGFLAWQGKKNLYGEKLALLLQLKLDYTDGTSELVCSDKSWKSNTGPILKSDIYNGEIYDARLELSGWDQSAYDDKKWRTVNLCTYDYTNLVASDGVPVCITERLKPVDKIMTPKGELVFDFGQNMVGWVHFKLKGKRGDKITLNHAEVLDREGHFYTANLRNAKAQDVYWFKGGEVEEYAPRFTFHGFRYVKISDYQGEVEASDLEACVVHSDIKPTGHFECSDELINRLQKNIQWGLRGNFLDVPTDCPQRDERLGWTGDAQVFAPTACFNNDVVAFYAKWLKDLAVDQKPNGSVPWVVPNCVKDGGGTGWSDGFGSTAWADAVVIIPWTVYRVYGNVRILEEQYSSMKNWVEYMINEAGDSCVFSSGFHFGDWLSFAEYYSYNYKAPDYGYAGANTDKELIATAYFYYTTGLIEKTAGVLGKEEDVQRYGQILPKIKEAFNREFVTSSGRLTSGTQTAYALALCFDLLPKELIPIVAKRLADDVNYFGHLTTGFVGTPILCRALSDFAYAEEACKLLFNKKYPSWLYPITKGATTIWERWDCIKPDGSFQTEGMNSFNHYAYGAVGSWLYQTVAGLQMDDDEPAYKKIIIRPLLIEKLKHAKAVFHSVHGKIVAGWEKRAGKILLNVEIPANTSARIYLPSGDWSELTESARKPEDSPGIEQVTIEYDKLVIRLGSGSYRFSN